MSEPIALPEHLRLGRSELAEAALLRLYARHPALETRFGAAGRRTCLEDLHHHLSQLAAALESGSPAPFQAYLRWLAAVLEHRGIPRAHLAESLQDLGAVVAERLGTADQAAVNALIEAGVAEIHTQTPPRLDGALAEPLPVAAPFTEALLAGDRRQAQAIVQAHLEGGGDLLSLYARVIQPSLYQVGQLWQENRISVAQEHLATAVAQHVMALAYTHGTFAPACHRRALLACVAGNHHTVGLRMVSDLFERAGWEVAYLGADTPTAALLAQVQQFRPEVVALSISQVEQLGAAREAVACLRRALEADCPHLLVGGILLNQVEDLWRPTGADAWLPGLEAVAEWLK